MKAVLLAISFVFLLSASVFASVLVIEGYEEFKLASLDDAVAVIGSKLVDENLIEKALENLSQISRKERLLR